MRQKRASNLIHECKAAESICDSHMASAPLSQEDHTVHPVGGHSETHLVTGLAVSITHSDMDVGTERRKIGSSEVFNNVARDCGKLRRHRGKRGGGKCFGAVHETTMEAHHSAGKSGVISPAGT